jgi:alpha-ketoglutarate-dependent taurine dioxygenase
MIEDYIMTLEVRRLTPFLGAEIVGLDLSCDLDSEVVRLLTAAWAAHGVLVFRGSPLSDDAHVRFARHFGTPGTFRQRVEGAGVVHEIFKAGNVDEQGNLLPASSDRAQLVMLNWSWHTDSSYRPTPTKGTILRAMAVPDEGGDTVFANLVAAYDALPAAARARIDGLFARHSFEFLVTSRGFPPMNTDDSVRLPSVEHPLVRRHADGRRSLYLSPPYMECIIGLGPSESVALVTELTDWATQERFLYRHHWAPYDVVMWDNGWTMHMVTPYDLTRCRRVMHGTTLQGTDPIEPRSSQAVTSL